METEKIIQAKLDYWINTEFFKGTDKKRKLKKNILRYENEGLSAEKICNVVTHNLAETIKKKRGKKQKLFVQIAFGQVSHRWFVRYLEKRFGWEGMERSDVYRDSQDAVASLSLRFDFERENPDDQIRCFIDGINLSTMCIAEDHLRNGGRICDLNTVLYKKYVNDWLDFVKSECNSGDYDEIIHESVSACYKKTEEWISVLVPEMVNVLGGENSGNEKKISKMVQMYVCCSVSADPMEKIRFNDACGLGMDSFYIEDLELIKKNIEGKRFGSTPYEKNVLRCILDDTENHFAGRINISPSAKDKESVRNLFDRMFKGTAYPVGKWPGGNSPYLMQQLAVNLFREGSVPVFTVNGPPGTGKTTLVQEVIADVLTRKVIRMTEILEDNEYETDSLFEERNNHGPVLKEQYRDLYDYGILISSGNNAAVENITVELPQKLKRITSYNNILEENGCGIYTKLPVSAPFGKKENLNSFINDKRIIKQYADGEGERDYFSFLNEKKQEEITGNARRLLKTECKEFTNCLNRIYTILKSEKITNYNTKIKWLWDNYNKTGKEYLAAQKFNPADHKKYNELREELFIRAWKIHQLFAFSSNILRTVFSQALEMIYGGETDWYPGLTKDSAVMMYNSLFLVTPVISSTFASIRRTFKNLAFGSSLGILIVDEAGQIELQDALGALFRVKRALIVGDPKQIPPISRQDFAAVLTIPDFMRNKKTSRRKMEDSIPSLQKCADHLNPYGTITDGTWVGCPLVLHSRCASPMFEISNGLSYDNTMINLSGNSSYTKNKEFILDDSYWIQVCGKVSPGEKNYYVKRQARAVLKMIVEKCCIIEKMEKEENKKEGLPLFVITPFVSVARGFSSHVNYYIKSQEKMVSDKDEFRSAVIKRLKSWYGKNRIGTVHTFQGRETDEVILLLGCDKTTQGAADWIFKNIVNVAASRARYRFYIVGDMEIWRRHRADSETKEESPVNIARRILNSTAGKERKLSQTDLNNLLENTRDISLDTRKEKAEFICPVCKSAVVNGAYGWFCRGKKCGMKFTVSGSLTDYRLNSVAIKKLLAGEKVLFDPNDFDRKTYVVYPEIKDIWVKDRKSCEKRLIRKFVCEEGPEHERTSIRKPAESETLREKNIPQTLICNCSKLVQELKKEENRYLIPDYFDFMILDAIYTIGKNEKERFTAFDILRLLSGNPAPNTQSRVLDEIDARIGKMTVNGLYKAPEWAETDPSKLLLPNICIIKKHLYGFDKDKDEPIFFEFLDEYERRAKEEGKGREAKRAVVEIPTEYLNPIYEADGKEKTVFPITVKWLMLRHYILYRIAYMYKVRLTNRSINFSRMDEVLKLSHLDEKEKPWSYNRMEKKRFRGSVGLFMTFLREKHYIDSYELVETNDEEGYCGIRNILINPK